MSAQFGSLLLRARDFLLEPDGRLPLPAGGGPAGNEPAAGPLEVAVVGLSAGCGTTTVARALALAVASPARPACLVAFDPGARADERLPGPVDVRAVPAALVDPQEATAYGATAARLVGEGVAAAVIWDVGAGEAARGGPAIERSGVLVAVAAGSGEPALAGLVRDVLCENGRRVLLVCNRPQDDAWSRWADVCLPDSRLGAAWIRRGRSPGGGLAAAIVQLAAMAQPGEGGASADAASRAPGTRAAPRASGGAVPWG
jgi:hypothetical protein